MLERSAAGRLSGTAAAAGAATEQAMPFCGTLELVAALEQLLESSEAS